MTPQQLVYRSKSWKDFEHKLSKLQPKERGTAFEWLCVFYLQIEPRYRTTYKRVLHSSEFLKESGIKKILGFTQNKEEGADAIAERYDGKIDIIQCKYLDSTDKNLTKKHIESPLEVAKGNTAKQYVDTILMCSNAKGLTKNEDLRKRHPNIQFRAVLGGDFKELIKEDFNNIRKIIDGSIPEYKSKNPFKHQQRARDNILEHFKKENRGQIIHACGTGKTLTSYFTYRELKPRLTLFAVPSLQLINQTLLEWTKESLADDSPISPFVV
ncbi:DEAD/DEAH box helicase family protein, partial [Gammaproteobacteria bacterium]|nr:DEAD/DEAH box helicase family protein [Gammaproteobacteria bacterium]